MENAKLGINYAKRIAANFQRRMAMLRISCTQT